MNPDILKENRDLILLKILRGVKRIAAKHSIEVSTVAGIVIKVWSPISLNRRSYECLADITMHNVLFLSFAESENCIAAILECKISTTM